MAAVNAQVEELAGNRVRLRVDVPGKDVHHAVEHAATDLAKTVKIPGFRKGRVPMPVLVSRVGRERIYAEAIESHIGGWFWNAAARSGIRPVAQPELDYELPSTDQADWSFTATVSVLPKPELADWTTLEVPGADAEVPQDLVEHELDVLRGTVAELAPVEDRPARPGDTVVVDLVSPDGTAQRDYVIELGAGNVVEEVEQTLVGMSSGETQPVEFELAEGGNRTLEATLKEIKEKVLPELDDELARAASEYDTLDELRADIHERLRAQIEDEVEGQFRSDAVDALVDASEVAAEGPLVDTRTRELLQGLAASVERRGVPFETYLTMTGTDPNELVDRLREEARRSVARELVLEAAAEQLGIEIPDEEVESLVREQAESVGQEADEAVQEFRERGAFERLRQDLRLRAALDRIASEVKRIPLELAEAREQIWTPGKESEGVKPKLWTPGSKEPAA
jgi:trigger factor